MGLAIVLLISTLSYPCLSKNPEEIEKEIDRISRELNHRTYFEKHGRKFLGWGHTLLYLGRDETRRQQALNEMILALAKIEEDKIPLTSSLAKRIQVFLADDLPKAMRNSNGSWDYARYYDIKTLLSIAKNLEDSRFPVSGKTRDEVEELRLQIQSAKKSFAEYIEEGRKARIILFDEPKPLQAKATGISAEELETKTIEFIEADPATPNRLAFWVLDEETIRFELPKEAMRMTKRFPKEAFGILASNLLKTPGGMWMHRSSLNDYFQFVYQNEFKDLSLDDEGSVSFWSIPLGKNREGLASFGVGEIPGNRLTKAQIEKVYRDSQGPVLCGPSLEKLEPHNWNYLLKR